MVPAAAIVIPLLRELPAARAMAVAFFCLLGLLILWRGFVVKVVIDDSGVKVVDYLRSHTIAWSEIVRIGPVHYEEMGTTFGFETRAKGTISPLFLTDAGMNPRILDALRRHATTRGIPFEEFEREGRERDRH
ncbi:MAG: PH domain-containing protein [Rubrobacteraceae bacterium]